MRRTGKVQNTGFSLLGTLLIFLNVGVVAGSSVLLYAAITQNGGSIFWGISAVFAVVLVFTAIAVGIDYMRRKITVERPVRQILEATDKMAKGDFEVNLEPLHPWGKYDEYDVIAENLNRTARELSKTEMLRSDFVSNVSHEIKTPLAVIQNYSTALGESVISDEKRREYAEVLIHTAKKLSLLVDNILKLDKLENRELYPKNESFDLGEAVRESVIDFDGRLESKAISIDCDIDDICINSDRELLSLVWNNLLSNAVKFTPEGGHIAVSVKRQDENSISVIISDSGCGMTEETGSRIFDKFYQGDTSHSSDGNGLGLALVKKVIDIIGGEIKVESAEGVGSTFTVTIRK